MRLFVHPFSDEAGQGRSAAGDDGVEELHEHAIASESLRSDRLAGFQPAGEDTDDRSRRRVAGERLLRGQQSDVVLLALRRLDAAQVHRRRAHPVPPSGLTPKIHGPPSGLR